MLVTVVKTKKEEGLGKVLGHQRVKTSADVLAALSEKLADKGIFTLDEVLDIFGLSGAVEPLHSHVNPTSPPSATAN